MIKNNNHKLKQSITVIYWYRKYPSLTEIEKDIEAGEMDVLQHEEVENMTKIKVTPERFDNLMDDLFQSNEWCDKYILTDGKRNVFIDKQGYSYPRYVGIIK